MTAQMTLLSPAEFHQAESDRLAAMNDFECTFAMFSEVAAEACRLAAQGVDVDCSISHSGLYVVISSPVTTGPFCVRTHELNSSFEDIEIVRSQFFGPTRYRSAMCVTDRFAIGFSAPLSAVEPLIETILRRFALMERNIDACRVWGVAA